MTKWFLLIFGLLLFVSGAWGWCWLSLRVHPADADRAFEPLARIPISQLRVQGNTELTITAPEGPIWQRIRRTWGDPEFVVAAISKAPELQYCFDTIAVSTLKGPNVRPVALSSTIYGYGSAYDLSCHSTGAEFRLRPGETAKLQLAVTGDTVPSAAEIVVMATWPLTKEKLLGVGIDADSHILVKGAFVIGVLAVLFSLVLLRRTRKSTAPAGSLR